MNILTVIFTLLTMLAILTYGRLNTFLEHKGIKAEYKLLMARQRLPYNEAQKRLCKSLKDTERRNGKKEDRKDDSTKEKFDEENEDGDEDEEEGDIQPVKPEPAPGNLSSSFYIGALLKRGDREDEEKAKRTRLFLKRLIDSLYQDHEFYQEMLSQRNDFVDQLLIQIADAAEREERRLAGRKKKERYKKTEDLSTMELNDPSLQAVFYKMMHGTREKHHLDKEEFKIKSGYVSLLDFVSVENRVKAKKLGVYLAKGEVLKALYGDDNLVLDIINTREQIYREVKRTCQPLPPEEGKKRLESLAKGKSCLGPDEEAMLTFEVSTTDPKKYR